MNTKHNAPSDRGDEKKGVSKPVNIRARDILATEFIKAPVVSVNPNTTVREIALLLSHRKISAAPVVDGKKIVGIVSERDLLQRRELGTELTLMGQGEYDVDIAKARGMHVCDVMSGDVITVSQDASLAEIVEIMLTKKIRRVLVTRDGELAGVVSRSDIVRVLAARPEGAGEPMSDDDDIIRFKVIETLLSIPGASPWLGNVTVSNGVVELDGTVEDEAAREPSRIAVENISTVIDVKDHRSVMQPY